MQAPARPWGNLTDNLTLQAYRGLLTLALPLIVAYTLWRAGRDSKVLGNGKRRYIAQRLGFALPALEAPLWLHCASLGEVITALPLIQALAVRDPQRLLLITTHTATGARIVRRQGLIHAFLPLDLPFAVRRFLRQVQPRGALILETELWPNLYLACAARGIPLAIINGRISARTAKAPRLVRRLYLQVLSCVAAVLARSEADRAAFVCLGAPPARVLSVGNLKFAPQPSTDALPDLIGRPYWLAASTHHDEEARIARVHRQTHDAQHRPALLVIAPRHPERGPAIVQALSRQGITCALRSRREAITEMTEVYIADTIGELHALLCYAQFVVMGGSLIERGGHNILEPARLGKATITGPHMKNFLDETERLDQAGGLIQVADEAALAHWVAQLKAEPALAQAIGARAAEFLAAQSDIVEVYLERLAALGFLPAA